MYEVNLNFPPLTVLVRTISSRKNKQCVSTIRVRLQCNQRFSTTGDGQSLIEVCIFFALFTKKNAELKMPEIFMRQKKVLLHVGRYLPWNGIHFLKSYQSAREIQNYYIEYLPQGGALLPGNGRNLPGRENFQNLLSKFKFSRSLSSSPWKVSSYV